MQHNSVPGPLTQKAFTFFFWFSRFEAALKESGFLKKVDVGSTAEPGWKQFIDAYKDNYVLTKSGQKLINLAPERQVVGSGKQLAWRPVATNDCQTELCKVVRMLKTVRNNVFHGGKSGGSGWDEPERTEELLDAATAELISLAELAGIKADLYQQY